MAKVIIVLSVLLATTLAEPPVDSNYLPPGKGSSHEHHDTQQIAFEESNGYKSASSSSAYLPPLENESFGRKNGHPSQLSNTYGVPSQQENFNDYSPDSVITDSFAGNGNSFSPRRLPSGNPTNASPSKLGIESGSFDPPTNSYEAPARAFQSAGRPLSQPSNTYGAPFRSGQSSFVPSARTSQVSNKYGLPPRPGFRSNTFGSRISAVPESEGANRFTAAFPSNTYGIPFNSALDNNIPPPANTHGAPSTYNAPFRAYNSPMNTYSAPPNTYEAPRNSYEAPSNAIGYSQPQSNDFSNGGYPASGYTRKTTTPDPLYEPANYEYNYEVQAADDSGAEFGHQETREDESARGVYHVLLPDGRMQIVEYQADENGYKPHIRYEDAGYPAAARSGQNGY